MVCVSKNYQRYAERLLGATSARTLPEEGHEFAAHYVFTQLQRALFGIGNNILFPKVVIVLLRDASESDIPPCFRSCRRYTWPKEYDDLMFYLMNPVKIVRGTIDGRRAQSLPVTNTTTKPAEASSRFASA